MLKDLFFTEWCRKEYYMSNNFQDEKIKQLKEITSYIKSCQSIEFIKSMIKKYVLNDYLSEHQWYEIGHLLRIHERSIT